MIPYRNETDASARRADQGRWGYSGSMSSADDDAIISLPDGRAPVVADSAFVAAGAKIVGDVSLGNETGVWYNAVLRGDSDAIAIGDRSNLQDGVAVHVDPGHPVRMGTDVSVGHNAVVHGCTIGDTVLVGMGAVILSGANIGDEVLIAGGAVVLGGTDIPSRSLVAGVPAKVRRELTDDEVESIRENAAHYVENARLHRRI